MTDTGPHDMRYLLHEIIKDEHTWKLVDDLMKIEDIQYGFIYNTAEKLHHVTFEYTIRGCKESYFDYLVQVELYKDSSFYVRVLDRITRAVQSYHSFNSPDISSVYHEVVKCISAVFTYGFTNNLKKLRDLEGLLVNHLTNEISKGDSK